MNSKQIKTPKNNIWIFADPHFGHSNLVAKGFRDRGFEYKIERNWKIMQPGDLFVCLGDVCFSKDAEAHERYIKPLVERGVNTCLVKGNHDNKSTNWYLKNGWQMVCHNFSGHYYGKYILFSHKPRMFNPEQPFDLNIHGHFHNSELHWQEPELRSLITDRHILYAPEYMDYRPITVEKILTDYNIKKFKTLMYEPIQNN